MDSAGKGKLGGKDHSESGGLGDLGFMLALFLPVFLFFCIGHVLKAGCESFNRWHLRHSTKTHVEQGNKNYHYHYCSLCGKVDSVEEGMRSTITDRGVTKWVCSECFNALRYDY